MSTWSSRAQKRSPRGRRSLTIRMPKPRISKASGAWGAFTALFGLLALTVQSVTLIALALTSLAGLAVTTFGGERVAVQTRRASTERGHSPGKSPSRRRPPAKPGTAMKRRKCDSTCRRSTKPASTCTCSCRGKSHGSDTFAQAKSPTKSQARSKQARTQERQVVRSQRKATP